MKSSRNKYHNILNLIPQISLERSKKLYDHFDSLQDFINNIDDAVALDEKTRWKNQVKKIKTFIAIHIHLLHIPGLTVSVGVDVLDS